jgi:hypothetical protein
MDPLFRFRHVSAAPLFGTAAGNAFRERVRSGSILPLCGIQWRRCATSTSCAASWTRPAPP